MRSRELVRADVGGMRLAGPISRAFYENVIRPVDVTKPWFSDQPRWTFSGLTTFYYAHKRRSHSIKFQQDNFGNYKIEKTADWGARYYSLSYKFAHHKREKKNFFLRDSTTTGCKT